MKENFKIISIAVIVLVGVSLAQAQWAGPDVQPPGGSVPSPIYTNGPAEQTKLGILNLEGGLNVIGTGVTTDSLVVAGEPGDGPNEIRGRLSTAGGLILEKRLPGAGLPSENGRFWVEGSYVDDGDPTTIANCEELQETIFESNTTYRLMNNIDCSATNPAFTGNGVLPAYADSIWAGHDIHHGFRPLRIYQVENTIFDGQGNEIQNIYIKPKQARGFLGLINAMDFAPGSVVRNIDMVNVEITNGTDHVGSLIGNFNEGIVENISIDGGSITATNDYIGGLIGRTSEGRNDNKFVQIRNSSADINVTGADAVGGLVGGLGKKESVISSSAHGDVSGFSGIGGLVGFMDTESLVSESYATGDIILRSGGFGTLYNSLGGLVGGAFVSDIERSASYGQFRNISGSGSAIAGLVGSLSNSSVVDSFTHSPYGHAGLVGGVNSASNVSRSFAASNPPEQELVVGLSTNSTCDSNFLDALTIEGKIDCGKRKTRTQMTDQSTYTNAGWDFANTWKQVSPNHYPCLQWMDDSMCVEAN